jgi:hypothetical protein
MCLQVTPLNTEMCRQVFVALIVLNFVGYCKSGSVENHGLARFHAAVVPNIDRSHRIASIMLISKVWTVPEERSW